MPGIVPGMPSTSTTFEISRDKLDKRGDRRVTQASSVQEWACRIEADTDIWLHGLSLYVSDIMAIGLKQAEVEARYWLDWCLEFAPSTCLRIVQSIHYVAVYVDVHDPNEAFLYKNRWHPQHKMISSPERRRNQRLKTAAPTDD